MVHAAHNSISALLYSFQQTKENWDETERIRHWFNSGKCQAKIILKVKNVEHIKKWIAKTYKYNPDIPTAIIKDGGKYEVEPDCIIGGAIGPLTPEEAIDIGLDKISLFR